MAILTEAPEAANIIDLDAARKARAEARAESGGEVTVIKLAAGFVECRPEFSLSVVEKLRSSDIRGALADLLLDPADTDALLAEGVTAQDLGVIVSFVGASVGEALASTKS